MKDTVPIDITYYRCSKRKQKCSQPCIRKEELENQLVDAITKPSIPKDFYDFICEELHTPDACDDNNSEKRNGDAA